MTIVTLVKVMAIKTADLSVFYREKHPEVFSQKCSHLHTYCKKHSRSNPEHLYIIMKWLFQNLHETLKWIPKIKTNLTVRIKVLWYNLQAMIGLPRNSWIYCLSLSFFLLFEHCSPLPSSLLVLLLERPFLLNCGSHGEAQVG